MSIVSLWSGPIAYMTSQRPGFTVAHVSICFGPKMGLVAIVAIAVRLMTGHGASGAAKGAEASHTHPTPQQLTVKLGSKMPFREITLKCVRPI